MNQRIGVLVVFIMLGGCSEIYEPKPHITGIQDNTVISNTSAIGHTFIIDKIHPTSSVPNRNRIPHFRN